MTKNIYDKIVESTVAYIFWLKIDYTAACGLATEMVMTIDNITSIFSPDYPSNYPNDANCTWHILATGDTRIELSIKDSEIERQVSIHLHITISS